MLCNDKIEQILKTNIEENLKIAYQKIQTDKQFCDMQDSVKIFKNLQDIFYTVVYGYTPECVPYLTYNLISCNAVGDRIRIKIVENLQNNNMQIAEPFLHTVIVAANMYSIYIEYIKAWFSVYIENLRNRYHIWQLQQYIAETLKDAALTYDFKVVLGTGIQYVSDTEIVIGYKDSFLENIVSSVVPEIENNAKLKELFIDTFKQCLHPLDLVHINNIITRKMYLYTKQTYLTLIKHTYTKALNKIHTGIGYIVIDDAFAAVVQITAIKKSQILNNTEDVYVQNIKATESERANGLDILRYQYILKPMTVTLGQRKMVHLECLLHDMQLI
jgi:hypothetical protein